MSSRSAADVVTQEELRFEYLIDRSLLQEQVVQVMVAEGEQS